jgi:hypothetical protein
VVKVPKLLDSFWGGASLKLPTGGSAKGIPLKVSMPAIELPTMVPEAICKLTGDRASIVFSTFSGVGAATTKEEKPRRAGRALDSFMSKTQQTTGDGREGERID